MDYLNSALFLFRIHTLFSDIGNLSCIIVRHEQTSLVFRLRDISEELLTVVAEVLLSELTFLRLVDTVSRGDSNNVSYAMSFYSLFVSPCHSVKGSS